MFFKYCTSTGILLPLFPNSVRFDCKPEIRECGGDWVKFFIGATRVVGVSDRKYEIWVVALVVVRTLPASYSSVPKNPFNNRTRGLEGGRLNRGFWKWASKGGFFNPLVTSNRRNFYIGISTFNSTAWAFIAQKQGKRGTSTSLFASSITFCFPFPLILFASLFPATPKCRCLLLGLTILLGSDEAADVFLRAIEIWCRYY